ncbi:hypothetical protein DOY81_003254 [Sarcophaga bullata]|nr:hypothetical protein DOY81_003254 [Sarcophaga bullata]
MKLQCVKIIMRPEQDMDVFKTNSCEILHNGMEDNHFITIFTEWLVINYGIRLKRYKWLNISVPYNLTQPHKTSKYGHNNEDIAAMKS